MEIRVDTTSTDVAEIKSGECFWYSGTLYMVIGDYSRMPEVTAVALSNGDIRKFAGDIQVERADCVVVSRTK